MGGGVHAFRGGFLGGIVGFLAAGDMGWRRGAFRGGGGGGHGMASWCLSRRGKEEEKKKGTEKEREGICPVGGEVRRRFKCFISYLLSQDLLFINFKCAYFQCEFILGIE